MLQKAQVLYMASFCGAVQAALQQCKEVYNTHTGEKEVFHEHVSGAGFYSFRVLPKNLKDFSCHQGESQTIDACLESLLCY